MSKKLTNFILVCACIIIVASGIMIYKFKIPLKPLHDNSKLVLKPYPGMGGDFALRDVYGSVFDTKKQRGTYLLLYFGFTACPDVCPNELNLFGNVLDGLGKNSEKLKIVFITIDPKRDTRQQLKSYMANFHPAIIALTGSEEEIKHVADLYRVYYAKDNDKDPDNYMLNHSSISYLIDKKGKFIHPFAPGTKTTEFLAVLKQLL